jgi:hypothetical protein
MSAQGPICVTRQQRTSGQLLPFNFTRNGLSLAGSVPNFRPIMFGSSEWSDRRPLGSPEFGRAACKGRRGKRLLLP